MALKLKGSTSGFVGLDAPSVAGNNTLILPENSGSAFQVFANDITAGVTTFTTVTVNRNGDLTVPGTISIGGTLTYEDVTSVDSIGIVTARGLSIFGNTSGLKVASGISTFQDIDVEGGLIVGNGVASPLSGFSAHFHSTGTSNRIQITTSNTGVTNADGAIIMVDSGSNMEILNRENTNIEFFTNNTQRLFIDSAGRLILGTNTARTFGGGVYAHLQLEGTTQQGSQFTVTRNTNDSFSPNISLVKTRGTSNGSTTTVQDNDSLGTIQFRGADGSDVFAVAASITGEVDGSPSDGTDMPGALVFGTTADGAASPTERLRIASDGKITVAANSSITFTNGNWAGDVAGKIQQNSNKLYIQGGTNGWQFRSSGGSARLEIDSNGTTTFDPSAGGTLKIGGSSAHTSKIVIADNAGTGNGNCLIEGGDGTDFFTIQSNGNVAFENGKGINFGASAGSGESSSILDDYEEGTWTPSYGSSSVPTSTYATTGGRYTRVGRLVTVTGRIQMSNSTTNTGALTMGGFPFACSNHNFPGGITFSYTDNWYGSGSGDTAQVTFLLVANTQYGYFYNGDGNTIGASSTYDNARRTLHFFGSYETDA